MINKTFIRLAAPRAGESGSVAIIFAFVAAAFIFAGGMTVDYSRAYNEKINLQAAIDAAVLAGTTRGLSDASSIEQAALESFRTNFQPTYNSRPGAPSFVYDPELKMLTGSVPAVVPTVFSQIFNFDTIDINASSTAQAMIERVEFVLSIDQSGSMFGARQAALIRALLDFQTALEAQVTFGSEVFIGIVPWQGIVNIGTQRKSAVIGLDRNRNLGLVSPLQSDEDPNNLVFSVNTNRENIIRALSSYDFDQQGFVGFNARMDRARLENFLNTANRNSRGNPSAVLPSQYPILSWRGCVLERDTRNVVATPPSLTIASFAPTVANRAGLAADEAVLRPPVGNDRFHVFYQPIDWGQINPSNRFLESNNDWDIFGDLTDRADTADNRRNPNIGCIRQEMEYFFNLADTGETNRLTTAINRLNPEDDVGSHTDASLGMVWALRMLDPAWRDFWDSAAPAGLPVDFQSGNGRKIIILMTDGRNGVAEGTYPQSWSAYGDLRNTLDPSLDDGGSNADIRRAEDVLNIRALRFCELARNKGVEVYTIAFDIDPNRDRSVNDYLQNCASQANARVADYSLIAGRNDLSAAFQEIARQQTTISLTR